MCKTVYTALVHVEVALEDPLLHSIRNLGLRHLAGGRLHDCNALSTLMSRTRRAQRGWRTGHGAAFGSGSEILSEIVTFAC